MLDARPDHAPTLHMLRGKVAAGESTFEVQPARVSGTIVVAQDPSMAELYPEKLRSIGDYVRLLPRLRPHIAGLLRGVSLWSSTRRPIAGRAAPGCRGIFETADSAHRLHLLDEVILARLPARIAGGHLEYQASDAEFAEFASCFEPPTPEEGFKVVMHPGR